MPSVAQIKPASSKDSSLETDLRALDGMKILATAEALQARVNQRFPDFGLSKVSDKLKQLTTNAIERADKLSRPSCWVRAGAVALGVLLVSALIITIRLGFLRSGEVASSLSDLAQGVDASVNEAILFFAAIYFLVTLEKRMKRRRALKALHELRSLAHIIDMHQLTKDPAVFAPE